jgi:NodT family efflux transporter outer membrane factor (OMF) lipoprotein
MKIQGCAAILLAGTMLQLCGCHGGAPVRDSGIVAGVAVPASWSEPNIAPVTTSVAAPATAPATAEPPLSQWWRRFNDPVLDALVTQALNDSTDVKSATAALGQAKALRTAAAAALWPTLDGAAITQRGTAGGHSTGGSDQLTLDGAWVLDVFGANRSALRASRASLEASAASLDYTRITVAAEVGVSYILLRSAQARALIATENLTSQQETLQITQWRQQAGLVTELETAQAVAAAEQTRALLASAQTSIEQTRHALAVLTGQPPAALDRLLAIVTPVPRSSDTPALGIPLDALRQRPDVRVAERQVAVAMAQLSQARAARWPGFTLSGSLSLDAADASALTDSASLVSSLLASMRLPLFDAGARRAQVRAHQAALEQARAAYESTVLAALRDVEDDIAALRGDRVRMQSLDNAASAATSAADLARQRYGSGLVDFQVVLETQRTRLATQDSLVGASADVGGDQVRLFKALGGGWRDAEVGPLQP